jgi:hydrogenase maturation protease
VSAREGGTPVRSTNPATGLAGALAESAEPLTLTLGPFEWGATARVLVAGIGNIFWGDDGFGVEVAQRLRGRHLPAGVDVVDFGTREFELACALGAAKAVILVDAYPHGSPPGNLTVVEPDLAMNLDGEVDTPEDESPGLDPVSVLRLARAMNTLPARLLLVGCEPQTRGDLDGHVGLSAPVAAAVRQAVRLIESLAADLVRQ